MAQEPSSEWSRIGQTRRTFLGASALGAAGLALTGGTGAADEGDGDGPENSQFAVAEHDHSGTHGAATNLGAESPVESITADDLVTADTPVVDVRAHGVVGDGETDDAAALQAAADAATPHGVLFIPADLHVYFESPIDINLGSEGHSRFAFISEGALKPAAGLGDAIHIHSEGSNVAHFPYVNVRIEGGGEDVDTDNAILVTNTNGGLFEGFANKYAGTVYSFRDSAMFSVGTLHTRECGQSLKIEDCGALGEFRDGWDTGPVRGPEFRNVHDLCINQYENYMAPWAEQGIVFEDCLSMWADKIAVGGHADTPPAEFHDSRQMFVKALHLGGSPTWGAVIDDVRFAMFNVFCNFIAKGVKYAGSETDANRVIVNGRNLSEKGLVVADDVSGGYHYFAGNIVSNDAQAVDVRTSDADIYLDNFYAVKNAAGDLSVPDENNVRLTDCRFDTVDGTPKTINGLGVAAADREKPSAKNWNVGDRVAFTDTEDGSGDGMYELLDQETWAKTAFETVDADVDLETVLVYQDNQLDTPGPWEPLEEGQTFGQTFTVDDDISEIQFRPATWQNPDSAVTMTLYAGSPADGDLTELVSERVDSLEDSQDMTLSFSTDRTGTFYLEMSDPEGTPGWWWSRGEERLRDVGGTAFVDREPAESANFIFSVIG